MQRICAVLCLALAATSCVGRSTVGRHLVSTRPAATVSEPIIDEAATIRLLFAGDVMLGRRVTPVAERDGPEVFEQIRHLVTSADLALANLESPMTTALHISETPNDLRAPPELVQLLAGAGFDAVSVANNHSGDAGTTGFGDTLKAIEDAGLVAIGTAQESGSAIPIRLTLRGITLSLLGYDATRLGLAPSVEHLGSALLDLDVATAQVAEEALTADLVVVSLHGGVEYLLDRDPILSDAATQLVDAGADIVWGHGPHVVQPITANAHSMVATSLGNLLFDQTRATTQTGLLLEVLAAADGPVAYRLIETSHADLRVDFEEAQPPIGNAALIDDTWWNLTAVPLLSPVQAAEPQGFPWGTVTTAAAGPVMRPEQESLVVSYRHPFRETEVNRLYPDHDFTDAFGMSAHLGVFEPHTYEPIWAAGTLLRPVAALAVCDGSLALAFNELDDPTVVATSAWTWHGFGFRTATELLGPGTPACADVDHDGRLEPVILGR